MGRGLIGAAAEGYLRADNLVARIVTADRDADELNGAREDMYMVGTLGAAARHAVCGAVLRVGAFLNPDVLSPDLDRRALTNGQLARAVLDRPSA